MYFNLFAACNNETSVEVRSKLTTSTFRLSESQHAEFNLTGEDFISIEANKPVLVLQFLTVEEQNNNTHCDSFMLLVPPMEQREGQYIFSTVEIDGPQTVNLVITSSMREGLLLDGEPIFNTSSHWISIESSANYSAIQLAVNGGFHNLSHYSADALFAAMCYGYPLGMGLKDLPSTSFESNSSDTVPSHHPESTDFITEKMEYITTTHVPIIHYEVHEDSKGSPVEIHQHYIHPRSRGVSHTMIAVIVSLCSAIFFVIACILGFLVAECVCRRDETFRSAKVVPLVN